MPSDPLPGEKGEEEGVLAGNKGQEEGVLAGNKGQGGMHPSRGTIYKEESLAAVGHRGGRRHLADLHVLSIEEAVGRGRHPEVVDVVPPRSPLPHLHTPQACVQCAMFSVQCAVDT